MSARATQVFGALCALLLALAAAAQDERVAAPFLWQVQGPLATHYLAGSVHLLPDEAHPLPDAIELAYAETRELVLETDPLALGAPALQERLAAAAREDGAGGLKARIGKPLYEKLQRHATRLGMAVPVCEKFRAWFCALALELYPLQQAGFTVENGLDLHFHARARDDGRAVIALETAESQVELFTRMPEPLSRQLLAATVDEGTYTSQAPVELYRVWRTGDIARIERLVDEMRKQYPQLYDRVLAQRNRAWIGPLATRLRGETPVLVVVGAAHLPGPDGLIAMLKAQGLDVRPAGARPVAEPAPLLQAQFAR